MVNMFFNLQSNLLRDLTHSMSQEPIRVHHIKLENDKLVCDCSCFTFVGIPCKHVMAFLFKRRFELGHLDFRCRWRKDYDSRSNSASEGIFK